MIARNLPTLCQIRDDFDNQRYEQARKKVNIFFRNGKRRGESEYRLASSICSSAYRQFTNLVSRGRKKEVQKLIDLFPECGFEYWLAYKES